MEHSFNKVIDLLYLAKQEGVEVVLHEERLQLKVAAGNKVDEDLLSAIKENKQLLIEYLSDDDWKAKGIGGNHIIPFNQAAGQPVPLSFGQERLWFIDQLGGSVEYHLPSVLKLQGDLNQMALQQAMKAVIERHEVLRTVMVQHDDGQVYQKTRSGSDWQLRPIDGQDMDAAALQHYIQACIREPFNLSSDYMLRATLVSLQERQYVLIVVIHHIACDAYSTAIIMDELLHFYDGYSAGDKPAFPALPLQYADFAAWQRSPAYAVLLQRQLAYWQRKLEAVVPLQLPADNPRTPAQSTKGAGFSYTISKNTADQLQSLSQQHGTTLFMTLLAVYNVLLYRYTGQRDICVGTSLASRQQKEVEALIGFFVNTLALRTRLDPDASFVSLLQQVKATTLEAYEHQDVPFEKVVETLVKERDPGHSPLFQVMLVLGNTPRSASLQQGKLQLSPVVYEQHTAKFELTFFITDTAQGLQITVQYFTSLYSENTIRNLTVHFENLLTSVVKEPDQKIGYLAMLSPDEEHTLQQWGHSQLVYPDKTGIATLFEQQVCQTPDAMALVFEERQLTYQQLNERANQLARHLAAKGVEPDSVVGLYMDRSEVMIVAVLAILKAGAGYLPLDSDVPAGRMYFMLQDASVRVLVTSAYTNTRLDDAVPLSVLVIQADAIPPQPVDNLDVQATGHQLAYVIYTSGSTGTPKGVMIEQSSLADYYYGLRERLPLIRQCRSFALVSSLATDLGNTVIYTSLLSGATLHVFSKTTASDGAYLYRYFADHQIDCVKIVPSHWKVLNVSAGILLLPVRLLIFGGEVLLREAVEQIFASGSGCRVANHYGPTETTIGKLFHLAESTYNYEATIPVGRPFGNTRAYVLSEQLQLCPVGVAGQLYIGGDGLARGYIGNPELTRQRFIPDPFKAGGISRMYDTGDRVRWTTQGDIMFIGRLDDQVKIRGYRVELGEVKRVMEESKLVVQAAVIAVEDNRGDKQMIAYVVPLAGEATDQTALLAYLHSQLPGYMIPAMLIELEHMPMTANGKIDRKALPEAGRRDRPSDRYAAPRNETEAKLVSLWKEVLEVDEAGIHDDFFAMGGHSLLAVRLVSSLRKAFGRETSIADIFDYPTIAQLAGRLHESAGVPKPVLAIEKASSLPDYIPLSFSQERLWFIDQLQGSQQYHVPTVLRLKGKPDLQALQQSMQEIISRHQVLRTVIRKQQGEPHQVIKDAESWQLELIAGKAMDQTTLHEVISGYLEAPFDLSEDYMIRAALVDVSGQEHLLVVVLHHIASDGWSTSVMVEELSELYQAYLEKRAAVLPQLPVQYADYAIWQRTYLQGRVLEEKMAYWKHQLDGVLSLQLPTDHPRPLLQTSRGAATVLRMSKELSGQLQELSQRQGATLYMTLLAAFNVLLYRYSGQRDICVGTPTAGRQQSELEGLIGFFINILAIRSDINPQASFIDLLHQVRTTLLDAYEHQDVPFEKVVEAVVKERDLGRSPLFQVMLILQNTPPVQQLRLGKLQLSVEPVMPLQPTSKFELTFNINETPQGFYLSVEYNADLYDEPTITKMTGHYVKLLSSIVACPQQSIGLLPMLSGAEVHELVYVFNDTAAVFPVHMSVISLFENQAAKTPDGVALRFGDATISYRRLNDRANELAHRLYTRGVQPGSLVAVCMEWCMELVVGILGVLKTGAVYVPIDNGYPQDRIRSIIRDSAISLLVTHTGFAAVFEIENLEVVCADALSADHCLFTKPSVDSRPEDLVCIIYTSGSAGTPKGVKLTNAGILNRLNWMWTTYPFTPGEINAIKTSISFVDHVCELFGALNKGISSVIFQKEEVLDLDKLICKLEDEKITRLVLVPSLLEAVLNKLREDRTRLPHMRYWTSSGEELPVHLVREFYGIFPASSHALLNIYGSTEVTADVSCYDTSAMVQEQGQQSGVFYHAVTIGKPVSNTRMYIMDEQEQLVPVGVAGEICIAGVQVSPGYLNSGELTSGRFVRDPFSSDATKRMFKSGDAGRWLPDGNIQYLGRIDAQIKIRGNRVEPAEIEHVLQQSGQVRQAAVLAKKDSSGYTYLVGYVVPKAPFEKQVVQEMLKGHLPDYMIPFVWVELESMPLTASGKLNRKALLQLDEHIQVAQAYTAPRNVLEQNLAVLWKQLLGLNQVSIDENFFELGGHSLLGMRLVSAVRKKIGVELSIKSLFVHPTIAGLAAYLQTQGNVLLLPFVEKQEPRPVHVPLSFSQERLWFIDRLQGSQQYHIPAVLRLRGKLDEGALSNALQQVVNRHEVLRTVIRQEEGSGYQLVKEAGSWMLQIVDGSIYKNNPEGLQHYIKTFIEAPFDLSEDYMIRAALVDVSGQEHLLVVVLHHIASDGWSTSVMVEELSELYQAYLEKRAAVLPQLPVQYADYAIWQRKYLQGKAWENKLGYWKEKLEGTAPLQLPTDYPRPLIQSSNGAVTGSRINKELVDELHALSRQQGVTLFMTLLAAFNVLLYRYSGQQDICVGTPIAGRQQQELEKLIGFFVNTLALRSQADESTSFTDFLQQVKTTTLEAYDHQEIPFEKVVEAVVKERDMSRSPLFQVMFVLLNTPDTGSLRLGDLQLSNAISGLSVHTTSKFDLTFTAAENAEGLTLMIEYCTDLYSQQTVNRMMVHFTKLLRSVVKTPQRSIAAMTMLEKDEQQMLLGFNDTMTECSKDKSIVYLFEEQTAKTPDTIAVVFEEKQLTYATLNSKANQLASYLYNKGVLPGALVPLCIERGIDMLISVLAILKAGAVYVPVDPEYPAERIRYIVEDTGAMLVISNTENVSKLITVKSTAFVNLTEDQLLISKEPTVNLQIPLDAENLAYVLYTSGSTGKPKGVRMPGRALVNLLSWQQKQFAFKNKRRVLQFSSLSFDLSFLEIFSTLCFGSCLYLIDAERRKDMIKMLGDVEQYGISHLFLPYIVLKTLAEHAAVLSHPLSSLKEIVTTGEQLKLTGDIRQLLSRTDITLINEYGPTETHVVSSFTVEPGGTDTSDLPPIGKPIDNTYLYVLGLEQQLVPVGVAGELYIGGVQVARGYLNLSDLTAERFIPDPFSQDPGARMYKTGDLARWLPDGNLEYLGRADEQIKIRGYRVEPGEIEAVLQQHELVNQAVILAKEDGYGNRNLVAYVVPAAGFDRKVVMSYLQSRLPEYMVPAIWVEMERLPVNSNGKVERKALPEPQVSHMLAKQYEAPRNELETTITEVWQALLGVQQIGIHDNFFELGGHSLSALKLVWQMQQKMKIQMRVNDVFIYPTVADLAGNIVEKVKNPSLPAANIKYLVPVKTSGNKPPLYLVAGGGGTALKIKNFADLLHPDQPVYVFQPPFGMAELKEFPDTIEEIAALFIKELLVQNPAGPYALSGHCLGGIIAFEMAQQLQVLGKKVALLAMFDTVIRKKAEPELGTLKNLYYIPFAIKRSISRLVLKVNFHAFLLRKHTRQSIRYKVTHLRTTHNKNKRKKIVANDLEYAGWEVFDESSDVYVKASRNYKLLPYDGNILLFYATERYFFFDRVKNIRYKKLYLDEKTKNNWKDYAASMSVYEIKGEHSDIFDPIHGKEFAHTLQRNLNNL